MKPYLLQYSLPGCYIFRFFPNFWRPNFQTPKNTTKPENYTFLTFFCNSPGVSTGKNNSSKLEYFLSERILSASGLGPKNWWKTIVLKNCNCIKNVHQNMFSFDTKKNNKNTVSSIITSLFFCLHCLLYIFGLNEEKTHCSSILWQGPQGKIKKWSRPVKNRCIHCCASFPEIWVILFF